jgi:ATP-dependent Lhr-like helicase
VPGHRHETGKFAGQSALRGMMHAMISAAGRAVGMQFKIRTRLMFRACLTTAIAVGQAYSAARLATYSIQDTAPFAVCLQEKRVGQQLWPDWLALPELTVSAGPITDYLIGQGFVDREDGMLFIGPQAERRFGRRHFMGLMAVFTAPEEFTVLQGRNEIGRVDPVLLIDGVPGPRLLLLGGRSWAGHLDRLETPPLLRRARRIRRPGSLADQRPGRHLLRIGPCHARRTTGRGPPLILTRRAAGTLAGLRSDSIGRARPDGTVVSGGDNDLRWRTWAGYRANATLKATLGGLADESQRVDDLSIQLRPDLRPQTWSTAVRELRGHLCLPEIDDKALAGLKFSEALPRHLAVATLAARLADLDHAAAVLAEPARFERQ